MPLSQAIRQGQEGMGTVVGVGGRDSDVDMTGDKTNVADDDGDSGDRPRRGMACMCNVAWHVCFPIIMVCIMAVAWQTMACVCVWEVLHAWHAAGIT